MISVYMSAGAGSAAPAPAAGAWTEMMHKQCPRDVGEIGAPKPMLRAQRSLQIGTEYPYSAHAPENCRTTFNLMAETLTFYGLCGDITQTESGAIEYKHPPVAWRAIGEQLERCMNARINDQERHKLVTEIDGISDEQKKGLEANIIRHGKWVRWLGGIQAYTKALEAKGTVKYVVFQYYEPYVIEGRPDSGVRSIMRITSYTNDSAGESVDFDAHAYDTKDGRILDKTYDYTVAPSDEDLTKLNTANQAYAVRVGETLKPAAAGSAAPAAAAAVPVEPTAWRSEWKESTVGDEFPFDTNQNKNIRAYIPLEREGKSKSRGSPIEESRTNSALRTASNKASREIKYLESVKNPSELTPSELERYNSIRDRHPLWTPPGAAAGAGGSGSGSPAPLNLIGKLDSAAASLVEGKKVEERDKETEGGKRRAKTHKKQRTPKRRATLKQNKRNTTVRRNRRRGKN